MFLIINWLKVTEGFFNRFINVIWSLWLLAFYEDDAISIKTLSFCNSVSLCTSIPVFTIILAKVFFIFYVITRFYIYSAIPDFFPKHSFYSMDSSCMSIKQLVCRTWKKRVNILTLPLNYHLTVNLSSNSME